MCVCVCMHAYMHAQSLSCVQLFAAPWTAACQAPLSMGLSQQESWSGLPFPSSWIFVTQGLNLGLLHCRQTLYHLRHQGNPVAQTDPFLVLLVEMCKVYSYCEKQDGSSSKN